MKKHAKRSLLLPILALCAVVAVAAGIYMTQAFSAYAGDVDSNLGITDQIVPEGTTASDAEESVNPELGTALEAEPNAEHYFDVRVHFSTNEYMYAEIYDDVEGTKPMYGMPYIHYKFKKSADHLIIVPNENGDGSYKIMGENNSAWPFTYTENIIVYMPALESYCDWSLISVGVDSYDITILIEPSYRIAFDANGGTFTTYSSDMEKYVQYVNESEGVNIKFPTTTALWQPVVQYPDNKKKFLGWFTERWGGEQVFEGTTTPAWGTYFVLYAHWTDNPTDDQLYKFSISQFSWLSGLNWQLNGWHNGFVNPGKTIVEEKGSSSVIDDRMISGILSKYSSSDDPTYFLDVLSTYDLNISFGFDTYNLFQNVPELDMSNQIVLYWETIDTEHGSFDQRSWRLLITPQFGQHFTSAYYNGSELPLYTGKVNNLSTYFNNMVLSSAFNMPGYIGVESNDGSFFKCNVLWMDWSDYAAGEGPVKYGDDDYYFSYLPIFVGANETVVYSFGGGDSWIPDIIGDSSNGLLGAQIGGNGDTSGVPLVITVRGENHARVYSFIDDLHTLYDWFGWNSTIKGVSLDGENLPVILNLQPLENGDHTFTLKMSDAPVETTVTYNANGGKFADDSDTVTLDAVYGEALPLTENPRAIGMDFVGWFTEPEGGVQVDPANYHWTPWDRWAGVTLYAHWVEAPLPPVPPEPGPTPEPVNPDVPGGGGSAQTGDSMPLVPIAVLAVIAALGCGLAIRKEYF